MQTRLYESRPRAAFRYPPRKCKAGRLRLVEFELLDGPGSAHDIPRIRGALRRVNQDRSRGALPGRLLELVRPPPIVSEDLAEEDGRIDESRIVDQHQQDFPAQIGALVVVPFPFGGANAVTDEGDITIGGDIGVGTFSPRDEGVPKPKTISECSRFPPGERGLRCHPDEGDRLEVRPVGARGFEAECLELCRDILRSNAAAYR